MGEPDAVVMGWLRAATAVREGDMCPSCRLHVVKDCICGEHVVCVGCGMPPLFCECLGSCF